MRIGIDALLLHGNYSGVEHSIRDLVTALLDLDTGNEYVAYVPADADVSALAGDRLCVRRMPIAGRHRLLRILWQQTALPRRIRRDGIDVFHGPGYVLPLRCPVPAVVTMYDVVALIRPDLASRSNVIHYKRVLPATARIARRIIVPSERTKHDVVTALGVEDATVCVAPLGVRKLYQPITDERTLASLRRRYELPERFFLFVGNVEPKKNLAGIAHAFAQYVTDGGPPAELIIAGAMGWAPARFVERLDVGEARKHVRYIGYIPDGDLPGLYSLAAALLFTSLYEGFGLPPLEAMACGTPAIVSDRGALPEVVGDAAPVVHLNEVSSDVGPAGIAEEMPQIMRRIVEDDAYRNRLATAGLERARRFTWPRHAESVLRVYNDVAQEAGVGH